MNDRSPVTVAGQPRILTGVSCAAPPKLVTHQGRRARSLFFREPNCRIAAARASASERGQRIAGFANGETPQPERTTPHHWLESPRRQFGDAYPHKGDLG